MASFSEVLVALGLGVTLLLLSTLAFDVLHVLLHRWTRIRKGYNYVAARWDAATLRHCLRFLAH